jgi:hypothetical protein
MEKIHPLIEVLVPGSFGVALELAKSITNSIPQIRDLYGEELAGRVSNAATMRTQSGGLTIIDIDWNYDGVQFMSINIQPRDIRNFRGFIRSDDTVNFAQ